MPTQTVFVNSKTKKLSLPLEGILFLDVLYQKVNLLASQKNEICWRIYNKTVKFSLSTTLNTIEVVQVETSI